MLCGSRFRTSASARQVELVSVVDDPSQEKIHILVAFTLRRTVLERGRVDFGDRHIPNTRWRLVWLVIHRTDLLGLERGTEDARAFTGEV